MGGEGGHAAAEVDALVDGDVHAPGYEVPVDLVQVADGWTHVSKTLGVRGSRWCIRTYQV